MPIAAYVLAELFHSGVGWTLTKQQGSNGRNIVNMLGGKRPEWGSNASEYGFGSWLQLAPQSQTAFDIHL